MRDWQDPDTGMYGMSQNRLGKEAQISQSVVNQVLKDGHTPTPEVLVKFAECFDANVLYLFRISYLNEDVDPIVQERLDHVQEIIDPLPPVMQAEFWGNVIAQAELYMAVDKELVPVKE